MQARPNPDNFAEWNEVMVERHDPDLYHTASPLILRLIERRRVSVLIQLLQLKPGDSVLEVGCGAGNVMERLPCGRRFGVDLSTLMLNKAADRLGRSRSALARMNAEHLGFANDTFDKVYCTEVLEHLLDPREALTEIKRVLKPGGIAVVSVPNEALINKVKSAVFSVPGLRRIIQGSSDYDMPERMDDEWHLHEFDRELLESQTRGLFEIKKLSGIPSTVFPLRWVAQLEPIQS